MVTYNPHVAINQFNTCVLPAIEYGVGVWYASTSSDKTTWEKLEVFWRYIAKCILGVSTCAPTGGVQGELAWHPFRVRAASHAISMWTRISRLPLSELTRKAMCVQRELLRNSHTCWLTSIHNTLCATAVGTNVWNLWWSIDNFPNTLTACESVLQPENCKRPWDVVCNDNFINYSISTWFEEVNRINAKVGEGNNKLRTYALYKNKWGYEKYLDFIDNRDKRVLYTKFRIGIAPLRIETGRHEHNPAKPGTPGIQANVRFCLCCRTERVEDEFHFLMVCPIYTQLRNQLFNVAKSVLLDFVNNHKITHELYSNLINNDKDFFVFLMKFEHKDIIRAVSNFLWEAFKCREHMLKS